MSDKRVGMLTVKSRLPGSKYECVCDCGGVRVVSVGHFNTGSIKSCGCHKVSHGHAAIGKRSREYISYHNMIARCTKPENKRYRDYGAVGITVCGRWMDSFENFLADMGGCPENFQIDRIDNNLGYSPDNCSWVSRKNNQANRRNSRIYTVNGKEYSSSIEAGIELGVNQNTILSWCGLRKHPSGGFYPAKSGCSYRMRYSEGLLNAK